MTFYLSDLNLPPEQLQAIGELTVLWSRLEWQVELAIWALLSLPFREGRIVTTQMNLRPKTEVLSLLLGEKISDPALRGQFDAINGRITAVQNDRNKIVHGLWTTDDVRAVVQSVKAINAELREFRNGLSASLGTPT